MWRNRVAVPPDLPRAARPASRRATPRVSSSSTPGRPSAASQFVDSHGSGRYHTYICDEIVPFVDARYELERLTAASRASRAAATAPTVTAMLRPDLFRGFASHAGGGAVRGLATSPYFRLAPGALRDAYDGSVERFLDELPHRPGAARAPGRPARPAPAGASRRAYSADPDGTIRLPYDTTTAQVIPELWERWLDWDYPYARAAPRRRAARAAGDLRRRRHPRRVVPRPRPRSGFAASSPRCASATCTSSSSTPRTSRSSTATRSACATSPTGCARR